MHWSKLFIPTLRDDPAEAEVASHKLLLRAGYIRQLAAGIYSHLFLAQRSLLKITVALVERGPKRSTEVPIANVVHEVLKMSESTQPRR